MQTALRSWRGERKAEEVAAALHVTLAMWSRWETGSRPVPAQRVIEVETLTGISRHDLRPDVFGPAKASAA